MTMTRQEWAFRCGDGGSMGRTLRRRERLIHVSAPLRKITFFEGTPHERSVTIANPDKMTHTTRRVKPVLPPPQPTGPYSGLTIE